jgi:hypothetical protein
LFALVYRTFFSGVILDGDRSARAEEYVFLTCHSVVFRLFGLGVRVPSYRSRGPGSILGATRFSERMVWDGVHSASSVKLRSYLKEKVAAPV